MVLVMWYAVVGLVGGWATGRLMTSTTDAVALDLATGAGGAVVIGLIAHAAPLGGASGIIAVAAATAGGIGVTFVRNAFGAAHASRWGHP